MLVVHWLVRYLGVAIAGKLSDQFGRKGVLLFSAILFTSSGIGCMFSGSISDLVILPHRWWCRYWCCFGDIATCIFPKFRFHATAEHWCRCTS